MPFEYSLTIVNHAQHSAYFMVFQNDPGSFDEDAMVVAWMSKYSNPAPTATVRFKWTTEWGFSWAETGPLGRGAVYEASEKVPVAHRRNRITLDYNGAYRFSKHRAGPDATCLYIDQSGDIPVVSNASVGVTMSGSTVYATQARPDHPIAASLRPVYYVAYGNYVPGEAVEAFAIANPLELPYQDGIYALSTTLNADHSWDPPVAVQARNERLLEARKQDGSTHWTGVRS